MKEIIKYCENCHKEVKAIIASEEVKYTIANSQVVIECDVPRCIECGTELNDNELFEKNSNMARDKYINDYNIISIDEIKSILDRLNVSDIELSEQLEWNNRTITKYLNGKLPTIEHSNKLREL